MEPRKKIVKLAKMIGGLPGVMNKIDENAPEYYTLACVVTDDMADVALAMELRKYKTIEEIAAKCKKPVEEAHRLAMQLADVGVCKVFQRDGKETFVIQIFAPGVLEMMVANKELFEKYPDIGRGFEEYTRMRIAPIAPMFSPGTGLVRVLPIESAIENIPGVEDYERVSYWLNKYDKFSVTDCMCRKTRRHMGEGCGHLEQDMCLALGESAEYYISTGKAREISRAEAAEIILRAEENGLVHETPNIEGPDGIPAICNCCSCSCFSLRTASMFKAPDVVRSNFVADLNSENCTACGRCVEFCPTNALKLGQKLCSKAPIKASITPSPRDRMWNEKYYNLDYRENRQDVAEQGTSPCKAECPAHIAVQGYVRLAAQGKYTEALELIKKENPFPAVCGRICPRACESACTRGSIDSPIAIDEIKKFIADKELNAQTRFVPKKAHDYGKSIAVIGGGPAGLSCAYYLAIDGYKVTVFEKQEKLGGMLTLGIPSFRLEKDVVNAEINILCELGVEFKTGVEVGRDVTIPQLRAQGFEAFYIAVGAQAGRRLNIEGEDAECVITGVDFLRDVNLGNEIKIEGRVVVIGGGNVAIDVARTAARVCNGAVKMYCLESATEMPALPEEIAEANSEGIEINNSWGPKRIVAENGKVTGVEFKKCVSVFENGKFAPKYNENDTIIVPADHVLLSIGQSIDWGKLLEGTKVVLNHNGTAVADKFTYQTNEKDIFVGGDVFTGPKFAIDAIAAGKQAAVSIHRAVWPGQSLTLGRDRREYHAFDKENIIVSGYDNTPRQTAGHDEGKANTFNDTRLTFTEEQMKKETERCLGCGAVTLDQEMCLGCGQCVIKCKFDAVHLIKKYNRPGISFEKLPSKLAPYAVKRTINIAGGGIKRIVKGDGSK
jgi:NADPH-dependent glutamate synthase beta subunit-like oxidoreductase/NAD-dependent dihydropyrimidine dehydrogenase PreA subunit